MDNSDFIKEEECMIYEIMSTLDGLEIEQAQDTLNKIQLLLRVAKTPIDMNKIQAIWFPEMHKKKTQQVTGFLFYKDQEFIAKGRNKQIHLYQRVGVWRCRLLPDRCLYYKLPNAPSKNLQKLTKSNLLHDFRGTSWEQGLLDFVTLHKVHKINRRTGDFKILEVLDSQ